MGSGQRQIIERSRQGDYTWRQVVVCKTTTCLMKTSWKRWSKERRGRRFAKKSAVENTLSTLAWAKAGARGTKQVLLGGFLANMNGTRKKADCGVGVGNGNRYYLTSTLLNFLAPAEGECLIKSEQGKK